MSRLWLSIPEAAVTLRWPEWQVRAWAVSGQPKTRVRDAALQVHAGAVAALVEEQRPSVRGGAELDATTEDEYRREQGT